MIDANTILKQIRSSCLFFSPKFSESGTSSSPTEDVDVISAFSLAITSVKYKLYPAPNEADYTNLQGRYHEVVAIANKIINEPGQYSAWLAAYVVDVLIDAENIGVVVDINLIMDLLNFIQSQQQEDGSFIYNIDSDPFKQIGPNVRLQAQTAQITAVLIKIYQLNFERNQIQIIINKSLQYLQYDFSQLMGMYKNIIIAYDLALWYNKEMPEIENVFKFKLIPKDLPVDIEMFSYLLLTKHRQNKDTYMEMRWLLQKTKSPKGLITPYHTAMAAKALLECLEGKLKDIRLKESNLTNADETKIIANIEEVQDERALLNVTVDIPSPNHDAFNVVMLEVELPRGWHVSKFSGSFKVRNRGSRVDHYEPLKNVNNCLCTSTEL